MDREDDLLQQIEALRERLSRLSEASLRINESLDFDVVLQDVLDSARTLIQARYGVITLLDESGQVRNSLSSGLTSEDFELVWGQKALIDTSPVGVLVFDAKTGVLTSINREARRIVSGLHLPDGSAEELLDMLTFRRADGRDAGQPWQLCYSSRKVIRSHGKTAKISRLYYTRIV